MKKYILLLISVFLIGYLVVVFGTKKIQFIGKYLTHNQIVFIKKYIFPYKFINEIETQLLEQKNHLESQKKKERERMLDADIQTRKYLHPLIFYKTDENINLGKKGLFMKKFTNINDIVVGINLVYPGSGYIEIYDDKLFLISSTGTIGYAELNEDILKFDQIKSNIETFLPKNLLIKHTGVSVKDMKFINDKIYISITDEIKKDCWTVSILKADFNYKNLEFKRLFPDNECVEKYKAWNNEFSWHQTGGRIYKYSDTEILFSTGEYRTRELAQDLKSVFGKILKINLIDGSHKVIAMGLRNPQGLFYDNLNKLILLTDHGTKGGDEFNLIDTNEEKIYNFGWPIAAYAEHYGGYDEEKYKRYPLLKSHSDNGFDEPIKYFKADSKGKTIGPSQIIGLKNINKEYVASSMYKRSLFTFNVNDENKLENLERIEVGERIRDMIYDDGKLYLYLENSSSIGIINFK